MSQTTVPDRANNTDGQQGMTMITEVIVWSLTISAARD